MVSKSQNKEAEASKAKSGSMAQGDEPKTVSKAPKAKSGSVEVGKSTQSKPSKRMRFSSTSEKDSSTATFDEEPKFGRGISTMSRVVKRKIEKVKPVVEFNKDGKPHGKAAIEMQSYIGVLARTRVPLVDKKWKQISKAVKEQIWEAVQMSYVIGDKYKNLVLSSAAKKWKDFKYNVTKHYILPFAHDRERLRETPALYKFIEKSQWDAFVASRFTPNFEAKHVEQKERREKLEYNHRLSRKGYVGLEDQLVETMPDIEEIDRAVLWKKAREDKTGNFPDPKVAEKAKLIDLSKLDMPPPLLALCQHVQTKLLPSKETVAVHMPKEVFGVEHDTFLLPEDILQFGSMVEIGTTVISVYMRFLFDYLKMANMVNLVRFVDPGLVSNGAGSISHRIKNLSNRLNTADGNQFFLVPYNPGVHWVMVIVRPSTETAYYMNSLPKRMVDDDMKNIVNTSIKMFNLHINKNSRKQQAIWKNLHGTPEQPTSVECGYYVMRFMRDIIHDPDLNFEKKFEKKKDKLQYKQEDIDEVRHEWAEFVNKQLLKDN